MPPPSPRNKNNPNKPRPNQIPLTTQTFSFIFTIRIIQRTNFVTEQEWLKQIISVLECFWQYITDFLKLAEWNQRVKLFLSLISAVSLECDEEYMKEILCSYRVSRWLQAAKLDVLNFRIWLPCWETIGRYASVFFTDCTLDTAFQKVKSIHKKELQNKTSTVSLSS